MKTCKTPPAAVTLHGANPEKLTKLLKGFRGDFKGREITISLRKGKVQQLNCKNAREVYQAIKKIIGKDLGIQEHFVVLYLTGSGKLIGYLDHTKGTTSRTLVDTQIITAVALKTLAKMIIIAHNHPSLDLHVTDADTTTTLEIKKGCAYFGVRLLDHLIVTPDDYYSMADHHHPSLDGTTMGVDDNADDLEKKLRQEIFTQLKNVTRVNSPHIWQVIHLPDGKLDTNGYVRIETALISRIIAFRITPAAAIPQLESEMDE